MAVAPHARSAAAAGVVWLWPVTALGVVLVGSGFTRVAGLIAVLSVLALWPASVLVREAFGRRAGAAASCAFVVALAAWLVLPRPMPIEQPGRLDLRLRGSDQAMRHVIRLPINSPEWRAAWASDPAPHATVWLWVASDWELTRRLAVFLNGAPIGHVGRETAVPPIVFDEYGRTDWHRVPVPRHALEAEPKIEVIVRPDPLSLPPDGQIGLLGGYSFRPTAGPAASGFFDGREWITTSARLFDPALPRNRTVSHLVGAFRFHVEVRLIQPRSNRILGAWY